MKIDDFNTATEIIAKIEIINNKLSALNSKAVGISFILVDDEKDTEVINAITDNILFNDTIVFIINELSNKKAILQSQFNSL